MVAPFLSNRFAAEALERQFIGNLRKAKRVLCFSDGAVGVAEQGSHLGTAFSGGSALRHAHVRIQSHGKGSHCSLIANIGD